MEILRWSTRHNETSRFVSQAGSAAGNLMVNPESLGYKAGICVAVCVDVAGTGW